MHTQKTETSPSGGVTAALSRLSNVLHDTEVELTRIVSPLPMRRHYRWDIFHGPNDGYEELRVHLHKSDPNRHGFYHIDELAELCKADGPPVHRFNVYFQYDGDELSYHKGDDKVLRRKVKKLTFKDIIDVWWSFYSEDIHDLYTNLKEASQEEF